MYHHYLFFDVLPDFYQLSEAKRGAAKKALTALFGTPTDLKIVPYITLGLKANTTFLLWVRSPEPTHTQRFVRQLLGTPIGPYLKLQHTYFGLARDSHYSARRGNPEQNMEEFEDRLPYLTVYPFVKTHEWHQLSFENRKAIMGQHVKMGLSYPEIRQCLLYAYGIDDYEFIVSYEMESLERFQDLVQSMRGLVGRPYTKSDTPIYTGVHTPFKELAAWL